MKQVVPQIYQRLLRLLRWRLWVVEKLRPSPWQETLAWAAVAGVLGALMALVFRNGIDLIHHLLTGTQLGIVDSFRELEWWQRLGVPAVGYVILVLDVRAYLRSLRRYLVRLGSVYPDTPAWAAPAIPTCLAEFGLQLPCSEEELKAAYRERVKRSHPDRGGDRRRFLKLQQHFEQALALVREEQSSAHETTRGRTTTYDAPPGRRTSRGE